MTSSKDFMPIPVKSTQAQKPVLVSEKLISLIFCILVAVFSLALALGFQTLAVHLSKGTWESDFTNTISNISSFVLTLTFLSVVVLSFSKLYLVINKLFQAFWESLEGE